MDIRYRKITHFWGIMLVLPAIIWSCSNMHSVYVDRLASAKVDIPNAVRRIAVVNNQPVLNNPQVLNFWMVDTRTLVDSLAQRLADSHYFDEVVVWDSVLTNMSDPIAYDRRQLSSSTVNNLSRQLGVDMLVSVEFTGFIPYEDVEYPFYGGTVYSLVKLYMPKQTQSVIHTLQAKEEICDIPDYLLEECVQSTATSMLLAQLVPHWTSVEFFYYAGANVDMRDASIYVREGNWEKAYELWNRQLNHKNRLRRMEANLNMAVWHEINDDSIGVAMQYARRAKELAMRKKDKASLIKNIIISDYIHEMEDRGKDLDRVKRQMKRFLDDF